MRPLLMMMVLALALAPIAAIDSVHAQPAPGTESTPYGQTDDGGNDWGWVGLLGLAGLLGLKRREPAGTRMTGDVRTSPATR